ncbi:MAG: hypothetical protein ACRDYV_03010, partial [Acidimicrobiia bacterium]
MCGIVAVLTRRSGASPPDADGLVTGVERALASLSGPGADLAAAADQLGALDQTLRGVSGVRALLGSPGLAQRLEDSMTGATRDLERIEADLDAGRPTPDGSPLETANAALIRLKDAVWAIRHDRLRAARAIAELT